MVPASSAFNFGTGDFTAEWISELTDGGSDVVFGIRGSADIPYCGVDGGVITFFGGTTLCQQDVLYVNDGSPHHCVIVRASGVISIYRDGVLAASISNSSQSESIGSSTITPGIGTDFAGNTSAYFKGTLQEVAVYNYALTQTQVTNHYNASLAPVVAFTVSPATIPANHSGNIQITATGNGNTSWTSGTTFSISSGLTGAAIVSGSTTVNVSAQTATFNVTTGSGTGTLTFTDSTDSKTASTTVAAATIALSPTTGTISAGRR